MAIYEKLLEVQKEGIQVLKDARNPHFRNTYASLESVLEKVIPALNDKGILVMQLPDNMFGTPALTTRFVDTEDGSSVECALPLILDKQNPQGVGSAITYYRRYSLLSMLGISADEDDDGNSAVTPVSELAVAEPKPLVAHDAASEAALSTPKF